MTIFIYPVIVAWTWGKGWLATEFNFRDAGGSVVLHVSVGFAGLAGLLLIGPRYNRYQYYENVFVNEGFIEKIR